MKKKVIRLNENDIERLVGKILKENKLNELNINSVVKKVKASGKIENHETEKLLGYVKNKIGSGSIDGDKLVGDGFTVKTNKTGFNVSKDNGKPQFFAFDQIGNLTKFIRENYDSLEVMSQHASKVFGDLKINISTLISSSNMISDGLSVATKDDLLVAISTLGDIIDKIIENMNGLKDEMFFGDNKKDTMVFISTLSRIQHRISVLTNHDIDYSDEDFRNQLEKTVNVIKDVSEKYGKSILSTIKSISRLMDKNFNNN